MLGRGAVGVPQAQGERLSQRDAGPGCRRRAAGARGEAEPERYWAGVPQPHWLGRGWLEERLGWGEADAEKCRAGVPQPHKLGRGWLEEKLGWGEAEAERCWAGERLRQRDAGPGRGWVGERLSSSYQ